MYRSVGSLGVGAKIAYKFVVCNDLYTKLFKKLTCCSMPYRFVVCKDLSHRPISSNRENKFGEDELDVEADRGGRAC